MREPERRGTFRTTVAVLCVIVLLILQVSSHVIDAFALQVVNPRSCFNSCSGHRRRAGSSWQRRGVETRLSMGVLDHNYGSKLLSATPANALERTAAHLEKLQKQQRHIRGGSRNGNRGNRAVDEIVQQYKNNAVPPDPLGDERERLYQTYLVQPASELKAELKRRQLPQKGNKPDLARRLASDDLVAAYGLVEHGKGDLHGSDDDDDDDDLLLSGSLSAVPAGHPPLRDAAAPPPVQRRSLFAGLSLSTAAARALTRAKFAQPSPIQAAAIPVLQAGESCVLHAATGSGACYFVNASLCVYARACMRTNAVGPSQLTLLYSPPSTAGKTLAYLLPVTERLWNEPSDSDSIALVLTPTRELAAQVAGIASILAPPGTVRLVSRPSNLTGRLPQERGDIVSDTTNVQPRIYVGSAKAIQQSLYGDGKMPAPPTSKPEAMWILQNTGYLVLDEVDRLLGVVGGNNNNGGRKKSASPEKTHEKPAAILTAAVARLTLGRAVTVAASATVGRPLKRELARCLGLTPQECPVTIRGAHGEIENGESGVAAAAAGNTDSAPPPLAGRAVSIPATVRHFVVPVTDGTSPGKLLTSAYAAIQALGPHQRVLLVLTRNFGISTQNAIGALKHFQCHPEPISLLDALVADGTEAMMELHRQVSGASGVGGSASADGDQQKQQQQQTGYLLVTGEDTVRGLHLDGLNVVLVAGRPVGPDEYTHIAGRTGRAGRTGSVINIVSDQDAAKLVSWENMLGIRYERCADANAVGQQMVG